MRLGFQTALDSCKRGSWEVKDVCGRSHVANVLLKLWCTINFDIYMIAVSTLMWHFCQSIWGIIFATWLRVTGQRSRSPWWTHSKQWPPVGSAAGLSSLDLDGFCHFLRCTIGWDKSMTLCWRYYIIHVAHFVIQCDEAFFEKHIIKTYEESCCAGLRSWQRWRRKKP